MVYISGGEVRESKSWSFTSIPELFWGIINFIVLFFQTMISPSMTKKGSTHTTDYRPDGGPQGGPRRRMGGFRGGGGAPDAPPMAGGG